MGQIIWDRRDGMFTDLLRLWSRHPTVQRPSPRGAVTRSFHTCEADHQAVTPADWWTDWMGSEVIERMMIFDPSKGEGGTTWSALPITPEIIEGDPTDPNISGAVAGSRGFVDSCSAE